MKIIYRETPIFGGGDIAKIINNSYSSYNKHDNINDRFYLSSVHVSSTITWRNICNAKTCSLMIAALAHLICSHRRLYIIIYSGSNVPYRVHVVELVEADE